MFYDNGLRFQCQMCRYCCSSEPGYVYLSEKEIEEEAAYLGLPREEFIKKYCRYVDCGEYSLVSLQETADYDCIFLTEKGCGIYQVRPYQCRQYPFWKSIMSSKEAWENEKNYCPGIGKGEIIPKREIEKRMKDGEPPLMVFRKK